MTVLRRRTLASEATVSGPTLFTARSVRLTFRPATVGGQGVVFRRIDLPGSAPIRALHSAVVSEPRRTVLRAETGSEAVRVETVEHVLSALAGMGITDAFVDLDGPEAPIGDGSASPFVEAISRAGVVELNGAHEAPRPIRVTQQLGVEDSQGRIDLLPIPHAGLELAYRLDYGPESPIPAQEATLSLPAGGAKDEYRAKIAPARTFCLLAEAQAMRKMGLFGHLEPRDMLVIGDDGPIDNQYRFPDEPARHKLLDLLGDLSLAGRPINARVVATRSGHSLNHAAARLLAGLE